MRPVDGEMFALVREGSMEDRPVKAFNCSFLALPPGIIAGPPKTLVGFSPTRQEVYRELRAFSNGDNAVDIDSRTKTSRARKEPHSNA